MVDFLLGGIPGIDPHRFCLETHNYLHHLNIIQDYVAQEENFLRIVIVDYDLDQIHNSNYFQRWMRNFSQASLLFEDLIEDNLLLNVFLTERELVSKMIYHKILKEDRRFKIHNLLSDED